MGGVLFPMVGAIKEHRLFLWVLLLGFLIGIIYLKIIPPWQHYDEPTQFEYAWLIANRPGLPKRGDYDQTMRREVAASMIENQFFRELKFKPNLISEQPIWIGISQIGELPLYYWFVSIPLRFIRFTDVVLQLRVVRLVSFFLYLVTIMAAYGIACELTKSGHPLRWLLPTSVAILPSFVDIMTAVNDDVGAVAFFSVFLWIGVCLIIKGFDWLRFILLILFASFSFWTKNTVVISAFLAIIPILFSIFRGTKQKVAWLALSAGVVITILAGFSWGDAKYWYRDYSTIEDTRASIGDSPVGANAITLPIHSGEASPQLIQVVPDSKKRELENQLVTIGAWIWADKPAKVRTPIVHNEDQVIFDEVQVNKEPNFYVVTAELEPKHRPLFILLSPISTPLNEELTVYYDGIVLTSGSHPQGNVPEFTSIHGEGGIWNGVEFANSVRNSSGEDSWPFVRDWADYLISKYFPGRPSLVLASILDFPTFRAYYSTTMKMLFESFWARFGWGNVTLAGYHPYIILGIFTFMGVIGIIFFVIRNWNRINWALFVFLGLSFGSIWGLALARGVSSYLGDQLIIPVARYAYPAVIPTLLLIDVGWLEIAKLANDYLRIPHKFSYALIFVFFVGLNILSIYSIIRFYQG